MISSRLPAVLVRRSEPSAPTADEVGYESRGLTLLVADGPKALPIARRLAADQPVVLVAPQTIEQQVIEETEKVDLQIISGRVLALHGWLGAFHGEFVSGDAGATAPLEAQGRGRAFDLVLDLSATPVIQRSVLPLGYFAPRGPGSIARAEATIRQLAGYFVKRRYFHYSLDLCAHEAYGTAGCTRCLDVCGAQAIRSTGTGIEVEPHLCQGCAACSLTCPTGALSFSLPNRDELLRATQQALRNCAASHPTIVVHSPEAADMVDGLGACVTLTVNPLPAFGEELWLMALALGAREVVLLDMPAMPAESRRLVEERLRVTEVILRAMGRDDLSVTLTAEPQDLTRLAGQTTETADNHATREVVTGLRKREFLMQGLAQIESAVSFPAAPLPKGAAFGTIELDEARCTLCSSCARLCPTAAIGFVGQPVAQLMFFEAACVQCGICQRGCPEHAIGLNPRLSPGDVRAAWRVLNEDSLVACIDCGQPFISGRLLQSLLRKAKEEMNLPPQQIEQMQRCPDCRQRRPV